MAMPAATAQQICLFALRKLGVVNRNMPVKAADMKDALEALWFVLDSFNRQSMLIPLYQTVSITLESGGRVFTIGEGGDFDCTPPLSIESVQVNSGGAIYNVSPMTGIEQFQNNNEYADLKQYPSFYIHNKTYPAQTITFSANLLEGDIVSLSGTFPFDATFSGTASDTSGVRTTPNPTNLSLTEEVEFPAGYQSLLMWCTAEMLLPEYPQDNQAIVQQIITEAQRARSQIKNRNSGGRTQSFTDTNGSRNRYWGNICAPYQ